jgi:hypothetical protein
MHLSRLIVGAGVAAVLSAAALAQGLDAEIDAHVAAAKTAAGLDFRNTLVNLCPIGASPARGIAPGRGAAPATGDNARGRAARGAPRRARSRQLVRAAVQGVRQPVLARHASAFLLGLADQRGPDTHRHELRVGH